MVHRKEFTPTEISDLRKLFKQKDKAELNSSEKKSIRDKMRNLGFYITDYAPDMDSEGFEELLKSNKKIKILGDSPCGKESLWKKLLSILKKVFSHTHNQEKDCSSTFSANSSNVVVGKKDSARADSDEYYVIGLCNKVLKKTASQQHKFDFLVGDSGTSLPVDAYYEDLNLVVEYHERQHTESVKLFDNKMTVSGVSRGEQRKIYDQRRESELPKHGIKLVVIDYSDFGTTKKIKRDLGKDIEVVRSILSEHGIV